jgi:hypothetical protein
MGAFLGMIRPDSFQINLEILDLIAEIDEFKGLGGLWALGTGAPVSPSSCGHH